ncbi:hypothetical protein COLU111180_16890 [Cohnella lubricantis]|uniref:Uncharacterized protein n=1 Tax=Cohnella lubricantis TaxID=2163172 RepID=A0A841TF90_9BACL|nr:hypothetical protein [Cohnella lubricantis]MBB6679692.1 hypothetical protein [Cohnella lubricantis]MBP2119386.1 hypothetical protein [Cohnella lubricantis]
MTEVEVKTGPRVEAEIEQKRSFEQGRRWRMDCGGDGVTEVEAEAAVEMEA